MSLNVLTEICSAECLIDGGLTTLLWRLVVAASALKARTIAVDFN